MFVISHLYLPILPLFTCFIQVYLENVEDEAPVFYPAEQVVFVTEFTPASIEFVYFVQAYDPDHPENGQLTFSFVNGKGFLIFYY